MRFCWCAAFPTPLDQFTVNVLHLVLGVLTRSYVRLEDGKTEEVVAF